MMWKRGQYVGLMLLAAAAVGDVRAEEGNFFTNMLRYGGTTVPPSQPKEVEEAYCPAIEVADGGAALRTFGGRAGDTASVRSQITLGRIARECARLQDGSVTVKVGVEGQVLLGPAGAPGRFEAPVKIEIKYGDKVVVSRLKRVTVTIGSGEAQGLFSLIEDNFVVPPSMSRDYDIVVGLGGSARAPSPKKRKAPVAAASPESAGPGVAQ